MPTYCIWTGENYCFVRIISQLRENKISGICLNLKVQGNLELYVKFVVKTQL